MSNSKTPQQTMSNKLFVSFSKRRRGLFNKASELCKICHAQVAVLVLSPTGNPSAFGHSSVDEVLHRYFLQQTTLMNNDINYHYPMTMTMSNSAIGITEKHRYLVQQLEGLKARIKQAQNRDSNKDYMTVRSLKAWIEKGPESCKTVEEFEFLKQKYLVLLDNVRSRLGKYSSSSWSSPLSLGEGKAVNNVETNKCLITGFEYCSNQLGIHDSLGMVGTDSFSNPHVGGPSEYCPNTDAFSDVLPDLAAIAGSQNDMSYTYLMEINQKRYSTENFEREAKRVKTCYGSGSGASTSTNSDNYGVEEGELLDNYVLDANDHDQYLITTAGFSGANSGIYTSSAGMVGDNSTSFFLPQNVTGGDCYADLYGNSTSPLDAVMGPMNDVSYSMGRFGHHNWVNSSYSTNDHQIVEESNDHVFNFP